MSEGDARLLSRYLSGYLCGTHSGLLAFSASGRRLGHQGPAFISALHRRLAPSDGLEDAVRLGGLRWEPQEQGRLAMRLRENLVSPGVVDLIFFGSQARGGRTGFSDVDAILVISDETADSAESLRALRPRILRAQRAVLSYQPLQHHGFDVVTPRLLRQAEPALALPSVAVSETCSLGGTSVAARLSAPGADGGDLRRTAASLARLRSWPANRWFAYLNLAMFELLPALYLQARGTSVSKAASFAEARRDFGPDWSPYDTLADVRTRWPRVRDRALETASAVVGNPWLAVAARRRVPAALPAPVRPLLTPRLLDALLRVAKAMVERAQ